MAHYDPKAPIIVTMDRDAAIDLVANLRIGARWLRERETPAADETADALSTLAHQVHAALWGGSRPEGHGR